jgi:hypothetical protein
MSVRRGFKNPEFLLSTYNTTYLLSPWSRVLLEKLTSFKLVMKFPALYGTGRFVTAFTSALSIS